MDLTWKKMDSAPSEVPCMTNEGLAILDTEYNSWYLCDSCGNIPRCVEEGRSISEVEPTCWLATMEELFSLPNNFE